MQQRPWAVVAATGAAVVASLTLTPYAVATPAGEPDPQRYVVQTESVQAVDAARQVGAEVDHTYREVLPGFSAELTPDQVERLRDDPRVEAVVPDGRLHASGTQANPGWGLDRIDQRSATGNKSYRYDRTGKGVTAYVIDTGIRVTHREFGGRARSGYDFVDSDTNATDCEGHGTHVAGTLGGTTYGVAKRVSLVALRVLDCEGSGYASDTLKALDWVVKHRSGPAVVNLSLGGAPNVLVDEAVRRTVAAGIPVVTAAGNEAMNACATSPAGVAQAITVSATSAKDARPAWANYGRCVDLFAPGVGIRSAVPSSTTASAFADGTSMAAPHVAGAVARYLENHEKATPSQVAAALTKAATTGRVTGLKGSPNRLLYVAPPPTAPGKPRSVTVTTSAAKRTATLRWATPSSTGGKAVKAYRVTRSGKDSAGAGPRTVTVPASARSYTFGKLLRDTRYTVTVRAVNSVGAGSAVSKTVRTAR